MDPHIPRPTPTPDGPDDLCISSYTNPFNFLYYIYICFFLLLYCLVNLLFISVLLPLLPVLSPGRISPRIPRIASDSREQVICTREIKAPPPSLISFVVSSFLLSFFFKNIFIIGTRRGKYEEAAVGGMLGARRQVLQDQRSQSSREREREKTALSPSFVLFLSFFSSSSFHSAHVLHYLQLFHLFLISYNFRV